MDLATFRATLSQNDPPPELNPPLRTLWWEAKGDWKRAHECAQADNSADGASVHAYLHRVEGDFANARYWYNRAGRPPVEGPLADEWLSLAKGFL